MPKTTTKSKHKSQDKPNSSFDIVLDNFLETGHFSLTDEIITTEMLDYFSEYLNQQPKSSSKLDYKFYLENVTFNLGSQRLSSREHLREAALDAFMYEIIGFSPQWSVVALDNVNILQDENYYPLSTYFIFRLFNELVKKKNGLMELIVKKALVITNTEFHPWVWMRILTSRSRFDSLTLELLSNEDKEDNFLHLCETLRYAKINILNLGDTEISKEGYRALNKLLHENYSIDKVLLRAPTDPKSRAILKENKARLTYIDDEKYLEKGWPLAKFDLNQLAEDQTRTVGHWLLENALAGNDKFMLRYLIEAGANLIEQRGDEKPFLLQIFEKNREFKLLILNHIIYHKTFSDTTKEVLRDHPGSQEILMKLENSLIAYAEILRERAWGLFDGYEMLLNLLKTMALLSRPSKQRDQEFIDIYWRLFKCVILFHDAAGKVTVESISNAQKMLSEIIAISKKADLGWNQGSKLHGGLTDQIGLLNDRMDDIKELVA